MPSPYTIMITITASLALLASVLSQAKLWQQKEYRLDRLSAALLGKELRSRPFTFFLALFFFSIKLPLAAIATFFIYHLWRGLRRGFSRPDKTNKAIILVTIIFTLIIVTLAILDRNFDLVWTLAATLLLVPLLAALATLITNIAATFSKHQIIQQATRLRRSLTNLKVIGITGSYGKTSTKHFLSQLIPTAQVTQEHRNSEFPVAQDMLTQLNTHTRIYIVEMGAYKVGEIAALTKLTKPTIGLITAIGNQHQATFGSAENILKAKWELIEALPENGLAIISADDQKLVQKTNELNAPLGKGGIGGILRYSTQHSSDIYVSNIIISSNSISCRLHIKDFVQAISLPLAGTAALSNVVAAITAAHALGIPNEEIATRAQQLIPYPRTMEIFQGKNNSTIIDDSYSANEQGVINAIEHLSKFNQPDKRIIIVPLIELGPAARPAHLNIGQSLAKSNAEIYVWGKDYKNELSNHNQTKNIHFITSPTELTHQAIKDMSAHTVLLLEGRIPDLIRKTALDLN